MPNIKALFKRQRQAAADVIDAVEEIRIALIVAQDQRQQIERLPVDRSRALAALDAGIAAAAAKLDTRMLLSGLTRPAGGQPHFHFDRIPENLVGPWLATLCPDRLRQHFVDQINDFYDERLDRDDPAEAARPALISKLDAEILALELAEEAFIRQAEKSGLPILRRADADPRAALAVGGAMPG